MNTDTRMAVCTHILALLALTPKGEHRTSTLLARSVNTNAVVVRRLVGSMKRAGLVAVLPGRGGTTIARAPETITLLDVYRAVLPAEKLCPFQVHQNPNLRCYVGKSIHDALEMPLAKVRQAVQQSLSSTTIADIAAFIQARRENN
ncbi:Rrf2 family transcriptional regulator [Desulfovibrio sp. OttesenSCG-928-O18]|nr:Rrf2 family transcriptional regulator [Desulfovibrio sp. OttesenSCG-928-O18]